MINSDWIEIVIAWLDAAGILLLSVIYPLRLYCQKKKLRPTHPVYRLNRSLRTIHKPLGILIIMLTFFHCRLSSQKLGPNMGTALLILLVLLLLTYAFRKFLKGKWMAMHRWLTAALWFLLIAHIIIDTERINTFMMKPFNLNHVFWYYLGYGLVTILLMAFMPKNKRKKILTYTPPGSGSEKILSVISRIARQSAVILSFFLPIKWDMMTFFPGNILYLAGLTLASLSMWQFAREDLDRPITGGIYRVTRNPMQVMGFIMITGIALVAGNLWLWLVTLIHIFASYPMFFMQERYCLEKYGKTYADYMEKTPRILLLKTRTK